MFFCTTMICYAQVYNILCNLVTFRFVESIGLEAILELWCFSQVEKAVDPTSWPLAPQATPWPLCLGKFALDSFPRSSPRSEDQPERFNQCFFTHFWNFVFVSGNCAILGDFVTNPGIRVGNSYEQWHHSYFLPDGRQTIKDGVSRFCVWLLWGVEFIWKGTPFMFWLTAGTGGGGLVELRGLSLDWLWSVMPLRWITERGEGPASQLRNRLLSPAAERKVLFWLAACLEQIILQSSSLCTFELYSTSVWRTRGWMNDVIIIHYPDSIKTLRQPPACMGISSQYYWASNTNKIQLQIQIKYKYPNKKTTNTQIRIYPNTQIQYDYPKSRHLPAWESLPSNNHLCCFSPLSTWITALQHFWIVLHIIRHFGAANPRYFKRNQRGGVSWQTSARCFVITCAFSAFSSVHI